MRRLVIGAAMLDQPHRGKCAAVEVTANLRTVLIDGAALLAEVDAGTIRALTQHQLTLSALHGEEVGQPLPIALLVYRNSGIVTASCTHTARKRPRLAAPPGREEFALIAAY